MSKKLIVKKGYTLTVSSWENDGDASQTLSKTVETVEEAQVWWDMMQLCKSQNQSRGIGKITLGNTYDGFNDKQEKIAIKFIQENHKILLPEDDINGEDVDDETLVDWFCELSSELLGSSEDYACRVMEKCVVTYSPEDVFLDEVIFGK